MTARPSAAKVLNPMERGIPLVGRTAELEVLICALSDAAGGKGGTVMVSGEAGIGKTRLAEEVLSLAESSGLVTYVGKCLPGHPYSYMPFRQAFRKVPAPVSGSNPTSSGYLVPAYDRLEDAGSSPAYSDQSSLKDVIHLSTLEFLVGESSIAPVVLLLEDLQWSDGPSLQLLQFLSRNIGGSRILILGNYRAEDLTSTDVRTAHPLKEALCQMDGEGGCVHLRLEPLDEGSTVTAVESLLGGSIDASVGSKIYQESGGNPLFALETTMLLVQVKSIIDVQGTWKPVDELSISMPQTVREVILRRLDYVPLHTRRVLDVASVIGMDFEPLAIMDIIRIDEPSLFDELRSLDTEHQLIKREGDCYRFRHAKLRETTYGSISSLRRRELHLRIGMSLEAKEGVKTVPGILSLHFHNAKSWDRCLKYSLLAGDDLLQRFAAAEALPYYQRAREALENDKSLETERARVVEGLADAYQESLDFLHADEQYIKVLPLLQKESDRARVLRKRMWCWDHDRLGNGSLDVQKELIEEGLSMSDIEPMERAEILSCKSNTLLHAGDADQAEKISETAISIFREAGAMPRLAWELIYCGYIDLSSMRFERAIERLSEAREILKEHPWSLAENNADQHMGRIMVYQGRSSEAIELFTRSFSRSLQLGENRVAGIACYYLALAYEEEGELQKTEEWIERGLKYASQGGYRPQMAMLELLQAHIAVVRGDVVGAEAFLRAAEDLYSGVDQGIRNFASGMLLVERGEVLFLKGEPLEGERSFEKGLKELSEVPNGTFYDALSSRWYGDMLLLAGRKADAMAQYRRSAESYGRLSNIIWADRLRDPISA